MIKTKVKYINSTTFGEYYHITIVDNSKFSFVLDKEEFMILKKQILEAS